MPISTRSTIEVPVPEPIDIVVCSVCQQPWGEHLARTSYWDDDPNNFDPLCRAVHVGDCLALTIEAQRGPAGPVGAMGPMGLAGPPMSDEQLRAALQGYERRD